MKCVKYVFMVTRSWADIAFRDMYLLTIYIWGGVVSKVQSPRCVEWFIIYSAMCDVCLLLTARAAEGHSPHNTWLVSQA